MPSQFEGFPNALLEAMYFGLPCVITRFNQSASDIITDGLDGFILEDKNDTAEMSSALKRLITNPELYNRMRDHIRSHVQEYTAKKVLPLFEKLL